jgi:hypothetical protein
MEFSQLLTVGSDGDVATQVEKQIAAVLSPPATVTFVNRYSSLIELPSGDSNEPVDLPADAFVNADRVAAAGQARDRFEGTTRQP